MNPAMRSVAFSVLLEWPEFAALPIRDAGRVVTDFMTKIEQDQTGRNPWDLYLEYRRDITPPDNHPGYLARYVAALRAGDERA
jgi:hypothetical protein